MVIRDVEGHAEVLAFRHSCGLKNADVWDLFYRMIFKSSCCECRLSFRSRTSDVEVGSQGREAVAGQRAVMVGVKGSGSVVHFYL